MVDKSLNSDIVYQGVAYKSIKVACEQLGANADTIGRRMREFEITFAQAMDIPPGADTKDYVAKHYKRDALARAHCLPFKRWGELFSP